MQLCFAVFALLVALPAAEASPPALRGSANPVSRPRLPPAGIPHAAEEQHKSCTLTAVAPAPERSPVVRARVLLLLSGALYGTYTVILRAIHKVGGEPLPAVFVTFARYQFLALFAFMLRGVRARQASTATDPATTPTDSSLWFAAAELAFYTVVASLTSVFGVQRVPAVMSEILSSTVHVFVPLQTLALVGSTSFGTPTWLGCLIAFSAAVISCIADSHGSARRVAGAGGPA